jgi:hypothetical protein
MIDINLHVRVKRRRVAPSHGGPRAQPTWKLLLLSAVVVAALGYTALGPDATAFLHALK